MSNQVIYEETQLTAAGTTTARKATPYKNFLVVYDINSIDTNVVVRFEGSIDGTNYFNLDEVGDTTITSDGTYAFRIANLPLGWIRFRFVSESGGTAATIDVQIMMHE